MESSRFLFIMKPPYRISLCIRHSAQIGVSRPCSHRVHLLKLREATQFVGLLTCMSSEYIPPSQVSPMTCFRRKDTFSILTAPRHEPPCPGFSPVFPCSANVTSDQSAAVVADWIIGY